MSICKRSLVKERRINDDPVPRHLEDVLTSPQMKALNQLESSNWFLWFIRRPQDRLAIPFLIDCELFRVAVLEADGSLNSDHRYSFRWDFSY